MKHNLYAPLLGRIIAEESGKKDPPKAAKTRIHQLYGAYVQANAHKKAAALLGGLIAQPQQEPQRQHVIGDMTRCPLRTGEAGGIAGQVSNEGLSFIAGHVPCDGLRSVAQKILTLHASTKERHLYAQFYEFIATHTGIVKSILDLGCGFNPFSIPLMPREFALEAYCAYDISLSTRDLLNDFFALLNLPPLAKCADLVSETPPEEADLALMQKLLPVLEAQSPGRGFALANALNAHFLVISYPLKSLGGREKGMGKNYSEIFANACARGALSNFTQVASEKIGNELIYVLQKTIF